MPLREIKYSSEKQDGRFKLTYGQKDEIRKGLADSISQKDLARKYGVSVTTIGFIANPDRYNASKKRVAAWNKENYDKDIHRKRVAKYRAKKRKLGLIAWKGNVRKQATV